MKAVAGFVRLRRGLLEHLPSMPANDLKVYVYLLLKVRPVGRDKGTYATTTRAMAEDLRMNRESVIASTRRLETRSPKPFIETIKARNQHGLTIYRVLRFDPDDAGTEYRPANDSAGRQSRPPRRPARRPADESKQPESSGLQIPNTKETEENTLSPADSFETWWKTYPRKLKKPSAEKAFRKAVRTPGDFERLMGNTRLWIDREFRHREPRYIPHPATFLNQGDWEDPPEGAPEPKREYTEAELIAMTTPEGKLQ